ncbi:MAG: MarR family transcriptional regulator [Hyphomicrobiaceae bacterium]|nr:MarR family transcriptional regulator [Hyphomicrobiaceae bacterium]MCC0007888.1 MarR family transcriptional regulator [Hyphomicrobiaceae bacterium]
MTMTSRGHILDLISRRSQTVAELAAALGLTRTAVVVQLQQLEADGLVRRGRLMRTGAAGKPGYEYEIVPGSEDRLSQAYGPLLEQLVVVLGRSLPAEQVTAIMEEAGRELARGAALSRLDDPRERLRQAVVIVNSLGACAEIFEDPTGALVVENRRCPFATAVRRDACVCRAAAAFFREATGLPFEQKCERGEAQLTCRYVAELEER